MNEQTSSIPSLTLDPNAAAAATQAAVEEAPVIEAASAPAEVKTEKPDLSALSAAEQAAVLGMPCEPLRDAVRVQVPDTAAATRLIVEHPALFTDYELVKGRMDDVFLAVTGKKLTGGAEK